MLRYLRVRVKDGQIPNIDAGSASDSMGRACGSYFRVKAETQSNGIETREKIVDEVATGLNC